MTLSIKQLHEILDEAKELEGMGIIIKEISRDGDRAMYVAEIPANGHVTPHFHPDPDDGTEWYQISEAGDNAIMYTGKPIKDDSEFVEVEWASPNNISTNDFFEVPNGTVHCLTAGNKRLRFIFEFPDANLDNDRDKIVLDKFLPF